MWHNLGWSIWSYSKNKLQEHCDKGSFKMLSVAFFFKKPIADSGIVFIFYKDFVYWFIWMSFVYSGEKIFDPLMILNSEGQTMRWGTDRNVFQNWLAF